MTSCGNQPLFKDGKGCGSCYKDQMQEGHVVLRQDGDGDHHRHELLPGGALPLRPQRHCVRPARQARPQRQAPPLRHHRHRVRVPCEFPGLKIGFHVEEYSNPVYFAVLVEYEDGDGDVVQVDLMESRGPGGGKWTRMRESWGSVWRLDSNHRLQAPFSIRIRNESGKTLVANKVIPANWRPNTFYRSFVQYS
ncbi:unnamed protein product [Triticum turgidum subsp. durum]|uniref:Expansin-like CBD domain-containing protein n=1 Tax=Triticum turgidum subsp. durum TaxID=4567 RepID=A0A9R0QAA5_TRITD|nr:unnamed protein product [Triticum turgidum subsp. durum]